jgi:hypothetical protein
MIRNEESVSVRRTHGGVSTRGPASTSSTALGLTSLGGGLFSFQTSPVIGEPFPRSSSSFITTRWLHLIYFFFFFRLGCAGRSLETAAAPLKAVAIDVRCHSCTSPDVDAPATGGLLAPRTNTLLPPRCFTPTNQFAGRWHGDACGGLPPRLALLRSSSHSFAASQSNAPAIAEKTFCGHAGGHAHFSRSVCPAMPFMPPMVNLPPTLLMPPRWRPWCQCSPSPCTNRCKFDKHSLSAVDLRVHEQGLKAAFTGAPTEGFSSVWPALCAPR